MPRIRTFKPGLHVHEFLFQAEQHYKLPLRVAFPGLFLCCNKKGCFRWETVLRLHVLPFDALNFGFVLEALAAAGFIYQYRVKDQLYGCIPSWPKHQRTEHEDDKSKIPDPPGIEFATHFRVRFMVPLPIPLEPWQPRDPRWETELVEWLSFQEEQRSEKVLSDPPRPSDPVPELKHTEQRRSALANTVANANTALVASSAIEQVFEHWKQVMRHPKAQLDSERKNLISQALDKAYTVEDLCQAITGCSYTPHNMGKNQQGQRYDGLHIIFKNSDQIDRFLANYKGGPAVLTKADPLNENNRRVANAWEAKIRAQRKFYAH